MNRDLNKGISHISYNLLNLPARMDMNASTAEAVTCYNYTADGRKLWGPLQMEQQPRDDAINSIRPGSHIGYYAQ